MKENEEVAPPFETWQQHLRDLDNARLAELAKDYQWLDCENHSGEMREEFHRKREAILAECERRGMKDAAAGCRKP